MPRRALLLLAVVLAGCDGQTTPPDAGGGGSGRASSADDDARAEQALIAREAAADRDRMAAAERLFPQLPPAEQAAIEEVRVLIRKRPPLELAPAQRELFTDRARYFRRDESLAYLFALADLHAARDLGPRLELKPEAKVQFKLAYANLPREKRQEARNALYKAINHGLGSLSGSERFALHGSGLGPFLTNLRE